MLKRHMSGFSRSQPQRRTHSAVHKQRSPAPLAWCGVLARESVSGERKGLALQQLEALKTRLRHYRWTRWGVTGVFAIGIGLSVLLQVLHAPAAGGWVAMVIGGFPPVAVFLCVEMISRIPMSGKLGTIARISIASAVAGLAIWVSYEQQYDYVGSLGFGGYSVILFPLIIDGVMFVATLSLVEVTKTVRTTLEQIAILSVPSVTPVPQPKVAEPVATPTKSGPAQSPSKPWRQHGGPRKPKTSAASTIREGIKQRPNHPNRPQDDVLEAVVIEKPALSLPSATEDTGAVTSRP